MGLAAGELDRRLTIERKTVTLNSLGEQVETWAPLASNIAASKSYRRANENVQAAEVAAIRVLRFVIRWSTTVATVNPKDRILFEGAYFDLIEVNEIGRKVGFEIFAQARAD
jgi:head-tail adaptor